MITFLACLCIIFICIFLLPVAAAFIMDKLDLYGDSDNDIIIAMIFFVSGMICWLLIGLVLGK